MTGAWVLSIFVGAASFYFCADLLAASSLYSGRIRIIPPVLTRPTDSWEVFAWVSSITIGILTARFVYRQVMKSDED